MHSLISRRAELAFQVRKVQIVIDLILLKHVWYKTVQKTYRGEIYASKGSPIAQDCGNYLLVKCFLQFNTPLPKAPSVPYKLRLLASSTELKLNQ